MKIINESLVLDEGTELLSRESMKVTNRVLTKTFFIQRALRFLVIVNCPNFFMLDSIIRNHRVRTLIDVIDRGKYKCISYNGIKKVAKEGAISKNVNSVKLRNGHFFHGYFQKEFPKTIDRNLYEKNKMQSIKTVLDSMKDDIIQQKMVAVGRIAKEIGIQKDTIIRMIKRGEVDGKMIANKYYLTRRSYEKLITP